MSYKVELDVYSGPLDLLLHLVSRDELTIERIPVARIADQFLAYLEDLRYIDLEVAGDFLVMAARLTEMKSRALLPQIPTEDEELEPDLLSDESDLIQRLLEYRRFKDASRWLKRKAGARGLLFPRGRTPLPDPAETGEESILPEHVSIYDILSAFVRISKEVMLDELRTVVYDDVPIEEHIQWILDRVAKEGWMAFSHLMPPGAEKLYVVGAFLALLELIRLKRVDVDQEEDFGNIKIQARPPEDDEPKAPEAGTKAPEGENTGKRGAVDGDSPDPYHDPEANP